MHVCNCSCVLYTVTATQTDIDLTFGDSSVLCFFLLAFVPAAFGGLKK